MENEQEQLDSINEEEEIVLEEEEEVVLEDDELEKLRKENATLKAQKEHFKAKATKPVEPAKEEEAKDSLSSKDLYALMTAGVNQEDISEVEDYAKLKRIPIADALKTPFLKSLLKDKEEERKTASATYSGTSKRTIKEETSDVILSRASKGELPEDAAKLAEARFAEKLKK